VTSFGRTIYSGQLSLTIIDRRRRWFAIAGIILLASIAVLGFRGLNLGIEFRGGADFTIPNAQCTVPEARSAAQPFISGQPIVTVSAAGTMRVQTEPVEAALGQEITRGLAAACGVGADTIKSQVVGPTWGGEISSKAFQGVVIFLVLVMLFLTVYFDWRMAIGALGALVFDLVTTTGVYALTGLEVTPATVIGLLTILAYSLYDTVVVFDKVKENTQNIAGQSVITFPEATNLALNQTIIRSVNTSIVALLPVLAIIVIGGWFLGAGTLLDLAVVLAIGLVAGTFSSIFIAAPILVAIRQRQPEMRALEARVRARRNQAAAKQAAPVGSVESAEEKAEPSTQPVEAPASPTVTTKMERSERQQPKRVPRSRRGKSR
jgi:preprotein translocase subunit SecF